jgi:hypothetical protein
VASCVVDVDVIVVCPRSSKIKYIEPTSVIHTPSSHLVLPLYLSLYLLEAKIKKTKKRAEREKERKSVYVRIFRANLSLVCVLGFSGWVGALKK